MQKARVYITNETFPALTGFLQKGIERQMKFFIFDVNNLIQNRLWTFSSTVFLPNVKDNDPLVKHSPSVIIANDVQSQVVDGYHVILFETSKITDNFTAFVKTKSDAKNILENVTSWETFMKTNDKWEVVTSLQP